MIWRLPPLLFEYDLDGPPEHQSLLICQNSQNCINLFLLKRLRGQRHRKTRGPGADRRRADGRRSRGPGLHCSSGNTTPAGGAGAHTDTSTWTEDPWPCPWGPQSAPVRPLGPTSIQQSPSTSCYYIAAKKKKNFLQISQLFCLLQKTIYKILQSPTSLRLLDVQVFWRG